MRGGNRSAKPAAIRAIQGSRKRPNQRPEVPAAPVSTLAPPPGLSPAERTVWKYYEPQLVAVKVLTALDRDCLADFCRARSEIAAIRKAQQDSAYMRLMVTVTIDGAGNEHFKAQTNPLDVQLRNWLTLARLAGAELGLSPVSRARVAPAGQTEEKDELESYIAAQAPALRRVK